MRDGLVSETGRGESEEKGGSHLSTSSSVLSGSTSNILNLEVLCEVFKANQERDASEISD